MDDERRYAELPLLGDLLPVIDNIERAIEAAEKNADAATLLSGFKMVAQQLNWRAGAASSASRSKRRASHLIRPCIRRSCSNRATSIPRTPFRRRPDRLPAARPRRATGTGRGFQVENNDGLSASAVGCQPDFSIAS